jgi:glycerol-3-phosphate acyltransferase PlsX
VCDGFVGNVVLKSLEGLAKMVASMLREEFTRNVVSLSAGVVARPVLNRMRDRVDNRRYNGGALLGLRGIVIKSHGSADDFAFGCALQRARDAVRNGLLEGTISAMDHLRQSLQAAAEQSAKLNNDISDPAS